MKWLYVISVSCILFIVGCKEKNKIRSIILKDSTRAEGIISKDSIYEGLIRFYDTRTNRLIMECNYKNGIEYGNAKEFYPNGHIAAEYSYENGKLIGFAYFYDTSSKLISKQFTYFDIRAGSSVNYTNGKVKSYWFYSLDNEALFNLTYDSLIRKKITELHSDFFFYHFKDYTEIANTSLRNKRKEYFLYTPNPPNYDFRYSLVLIDSSYKVHSELKNFDGNSPWSTFTVDESVNKIPAIRLTISDSISGGDIIMFKVLK